MNAAEFASMLHAKQVRRGHWQALCPAHSDRRPSLSIAAGRKHPVVFKCMSAGCTQNEVLAAMGLTWRDLLGDRPTMSPEARKRYSDEQYLHDLRETKRILIAAVHALCPEFPWNPRSDGSYGIDGMAELNRRIIATENRLNPELQAIRGRDAKTARFVQRWGWDRLWKIYLERNPQ